MIRIQMLTGPTAGLQTTHVEPRLSFGRAAENTICIDAAHLSRQHGELVCTDGLWHVVNHSPNGTMLNGRPIKGEQSRPLKSGDVVGVGPHKLFSVAVAPPDKQTIEEAPAESAEPRKAMSRRTKMWIGIGSYMLVMMIVIILLATVGGKKTTGRAIPEQLTDAQITSEIRQPIERVPDERKAAQHLSEARDWFARPNTRADALYQAHRNYKLAMAYMGATTLPEDQLQYDAAEKRLVDTIVEKYRRAYAMVLNKQWADAERLLRQITDMYPDTTSEVYGNVQDLIRYILSLKPKRNQFG